MVSVVEIDCSYTSAQWEVYKETRSSSQCPKDYLQLDNGWYLCLRAK
jgi:hypothetical protein